MPLQDDSKLYKNNEISNLIVGLGLGLKGEDLGSLRYGRVGAGSPGCAHPCFQLRPLTAPKRGVSLCGLCRALMSACKVQATFYAVRIGA